MKEEIYGTSMWDEINETKSQALESTIAGIHEPDTTPSTPTTLSSLELDGNPYETQQEVLSSLNLLDHNQNPTNTYTNYINQGNTPIPGYEQAHDTLLFLDRQQEKINQHQNNEITEDQMLWDLYGKDIMEANGYAVRSVAWWQNKYFNNDFTSPFDNRYLTSQVIEQARTHHNQLLAKKYAHQQSIEDSKLAAYTQKQDLSMTKVRELFPELTNYALYKNNDEQLEKDISSGRIHTRLRIHTTSGGERYYLHTDGRLYKLSNEETGSNIARYKTDQDGNLTEIDINQSEVITLGRSFVAGASSILTGLAKLVALPLGVISALDDSTSLVKGITDYTSAIDAWANDNASFLTDSGRVDLDGFKLTDMSDVANTIMYTWGMITGGRLIGAGANHVYNWGTKLAASGRPVSAATLKATANLWARSTGMYQGFGPDIEGSFSMFGKVLYTGKSSMFLNHTLKTVPTYMMKDFYQTLDQLQTQRIQYMISQHMEGKEPEDPTDDTKVLFHALGVTAVNGVISTVFAGGVNDKPTKRLQFMFEDLSEKYARMQKITGPLSTFYKWLSSPRLTISANTVSDFIDNFLTLGMNELVTVDKDGTHVEFSNITADLVVKNAVTAAVMSRPTYKSNVQGRNLGYESLVSLYKETLDTLDARIRVESDPEKLAQAQAARDLLVNDYNTATTVDGDTKLIPEERALYALNKFHQGIEDSNGHSIITDRLFKLTDEKVLDIYKQLSADAKEYYDSKLEAANTTIKEMNEKGAAKTFKEKARATIKAALSHKFRKASLLLDTQRRNENLDLELTRVAATYYNKYLDLVGSKTAQEFEDNYNRFVELKDSFDKTTEIVHTLDKEHEAKLNGVLDTIVGNLNVGEEHVEDVKKQIKSNMIFYKFKNEAGGDDRKILNTQRATASNLIKLLPDNIVKIDDDVYAFTGLGTEIQQLFTHDTYVKVSLATRLIAEDKFEEGAQLYLSTVLGDKDFKAAIAKDDVKIRDAKEALYLYLKDMVDSNAITKLKAVKFIEQLADSETDLGKALKNTLSNKTKVNHKNVNNAQKLNDIESYMIRYNAFKILRENNSKIGNASVSEAQRLLMDKFGNADPITKQVFEDMVKAGELSNEFFKNYNDLIVAATKNNETFQTTSNIERLLTDIAGDKESTFDEDKIDQAVSSILGDGADKKIKKELTDRIKASAQFIKDAKLKDVDLDENKVVINATLFTNLEKTKLDKELLNATTQEANNMLEKWSFTSDTETVNAIKRHLELCNEMVNSGEPYYVLDLNNPDDIAFLRYLNETYLHFTDNRLDTKDDCIRTLQGDFIEESAKSFIIYNYGKELATDIISEEEAAKINAYLLSERTYKKRGTDKVTIFYNDGSVSNVDLYTFIANSIGPAYISKAMKAREYIKADKDGNATLGLNPFNEKTVLENNVDIFQGTSLEEAIKTGRIGGEAAKKLRQLYSRGDSTTVNKIFSTELMMLKLVDELSSSEEKTIYLDFNTYNKMKKQGIVDAEDSFYKTDETFNRNIKKPKFVPVKLVATKEEMEFYVLHDSDFNIFKILPLASSKPLDTSNKFNFPGDYAIPDVTGGLSTVPRLPIYNIFTDIFEWDNGNRLRGELIDGIIANGKNLKYNPLAERTEEIKFDTAEEYKAYRDAGVILEDKNDIYYNLVLLYQAQDAAYVSDNTDQDFKLWLADAKTLKTIVDSSEELRALRNTDPKGYEEAKIKLTEKIIHDYESANANIPIATNYTTSGVTYNSFYGTEGLIGDNTIISKRLLDNIRGVGYNFVETDAAGNKHVYAEAPEDISKAIDFVTEYGQAFLDNTLLAGRASNGNYVAYEPSEDILLRVLMAGSDSRILIKDLDELYRIDAEAYNRLFEAAMGKEGLKVAARVKSGIDEMYKKYLELNSKNIKVTLEPNKEKTIRKARTKGAATGEDYSSLTHYNNLRGNKKLSEYVRDNYIVRKESTPKADMAKITDLIAGDVDDYEKVIYGNKDRFAHLYTNNPGQLEINNLSRGMNAYKVVNTIVQTSEALDKAFEEAGITGVDTMALADQLHLQSDGVRFMGEWAKYNLFDPATNTSTIASVGRNARGSGKDHTDVLVMLDKPDSELIGKVFFSLEKHNGRDTGALKFKYIVLKNENDINNLRASAILDIFEENKSNPKFEGGYSIESLRKMPKEKLLSILNAAINNSLLRKNINKRIVDTLKESNVSEENIHKILQDPEEYKTKYLENNVKQLVDGTYVPALFSDNPIVRQQASVIAYGLHYDLLDKNLQDIIQKARGLDEKAFEEKYWTIKEESNEELQKFYEQKKKDDLYNIKALAKALDTYYEEDSMDTINRVKEYFKDDPDGLKKMIEGYFVYGNADAGVIHYRVNKDESLVGMFDKRHEKSPTLDPLKLSFSRNKIDANDLKNFFNEESESKTKTINAIDFETTFSTKNAESIKDVWQIGIIHYVKQDDGTLQQEVSTKYIKHDGWESTRAWAEDPDNVDIRSNFYKNNESIRSSLETYKGLQEGDPDLITEEEALRLLADSEVLIAYNGESFDFKLIKDDITKLNKKIKFLDATELVKREQLDVRESAKLESVYFNGKRTFSQDFLGKAHNAEDDVKMMMEVFVEKLNSGFNLAKDRTSIIGKFEQLVDISTKEGMSRFKKVLNEIDTDLRKLESEESFNSKFKQDSRTIDDITYLARLFNHGMNTARGRLYNDLSKQLSDNSVKVRMIEDNTYHEANKVIAFVASTQGKEGIPDYNKALTMIKNAARDIAEEDRDMPGSSHTLKVLSDPDERLMNKLGLSLSAYEAKENNEEYKQAYGLLLGTLTKGKKALLDPNNIFKIPPSDYQDYLERGALDKIVFSIQGAMDDSEDVFKNNKDLQELWEHALIEPLTVNESFDVADLIDFIDENIHYRDKAIDTLVAQLNNILDEDTVASIRTQSGYKMFNSFDTHPIQLYWELDVLTGRTKRLDNIKAGDIVITKALLDKIVGYKGYDELLSEDGNLYLYTVSYPSDNPNSLMAHRVRVINDMGDGNTSVMRFGFTPETQAILRARDFDGDFLSFFKPVSKSSIQIAQAVNKYLYNEFDVEENLASVLRGMSVKNSRTLRYEAEALKMSADSDIKEICFLMDDALAKNDEASLASYSEKLKDIIRNKRNIRGKKFNEETVENIASYLGVVSKFGEGKEQIRFVNNPAIWTDDNTKKGYHSYTQRIAYYKLRAFHMTNILDSVTGYNQKLWSKERIDINDVKAPLVELYSPTIYLTDTLSTEISTKLTTVDNITKYFDTMYKSMKDNIENLGVTSNKWKSSVLTTFSNGIEEYKQNAIAKLQANDPETQDYIKTCTLDALHNFGLTIKHNAELNNKVLDILKSDTLDNSYLEQLNRNKQVMKTIKKLKGIKRRVRAMPKLDRHVEDIYLRSMIANQEDLARINLNTGEYNEVPDLLGEIKKLNNKQPVDFNKYFLKETSKIVDDHLHTANGFVFITDSPGLLVDEDTIGVTNHALVRSARVGTFNADLDHRYELPKKILNEFKKTNDALIPAGTVIGYKKVAGSSEEEPIVTNKPLHLAALELTSEGKISGLGFYVEESLNDKKVKIDNMAKAKAKFINVDEFNIYEYSKADAKKHERRSLGKARIDFIISMKNAVENTDKFGLLPHIGQSFNKMTRATIVVNGEKIHGYLVPKVDAFNIGDDSHYSTMLNTTLDLKAGNRTEVMLLGGQATTLPGIGGIVGNAVVFKNDDGTVSISNKRIAEMYTDPKEKGSVAYKNVAEVVLATRAQMLMDELDDSTMAAISKGKFKTTKEYMDNLLSSPDKLNTRKCAMELLYIQMVLGSDKVNKIRNKNSIAKAVFDPYFDEFVFYKTTPTDMYLSDDPSEDVIVSGNAQNIMARRFAPTTFGEDYNDSEVGLNKNQLVQGETFYIPWNWLYKNISGYEPNQQDILKGSISEEYFTVGRHYDDGGTFDNKWMPVNVHRAYRDGGIALSPSIANGRKSGVEAKAPDSIRVQGMTEDLTLGSGSYNILNDYNNPLKNTVSSMIGRALNNEKVYGDYSSSRQILSILDYLVNVNASYNKNKLSKLAAIRGVKGVEYALFNMGYRTINNELVKIGDIPTGRSSIRNATGDINAHAKTFWTYKDLIDQFEKANVNEETIESMLSSEAYANSVQYSKDKVEAKREKDKLTSQLFETLKQQDLNKSVQESRKPVRLTTNYKPTKEVFEYHPMSRSGINVVGAETGLVDMGIKNTGAYAEFYIQEMKTSLNELKGMVSEVNLKDFTDYAMYNMLKTAEQTDTPEMFEVRLKHAGITKEEYNSAERYSKYKDFINKNMPIVSKYEELVNTVITKYKDAADLVGEPLGPTYMFFAPYVLKDKGDSTATIRNTFHNIRTLNNFDPVKAGDMLKQNLMFNFFEGMEKVINEIGQISALDQMSKVLTGEYENTPAMIDNKSIMDKAFEILNTEELLTKVYVSDDIDVTPDVLSIISLYTDIDYYTISKNIKNKGSLLVDAFNKVKSKVEKAREDYTFETGEYKSLSDVYSDSRNMALNQDVRAEAQRLYDLMWSEIILAQRIMEIDGHAMDKMVDYIDSLSEQGKVLVNKFGQKISMDTLVKPLMGSSLRYLKDNLEISLNSMNKQTFAQFVMEKALSGELYIADADLAKQLEANFYTEKVGGRVTKTLKKISKASAGIQMSLPAKMLGRLLRFTGFDYVLDAIANPRSIPYMSIAAREIAQAMQTNGKVMSEDLIEYLKREGQPSIGQGSGKDPINFTEDMAISDFTNKLTRPLELQNHLGRYAIYLTAKKSFEEGNPWYGPLYHKKEAVDALPTPEDKAMYIMDYLLGSPGGFPHITKKTSGWMMYATFPMNLTRTMGAYGMSLSRLFQEGITEENSKYWMSSVVIPSGMAVGITYLGTLILDAICDMFGIDEETEEKWKEEGVWVDPIGTILGGTPSVVYDSINPVHNLKEMFINPWTNEYNDTLPKKAWGWVQSNFLSKLNPAIKTPTEILLRKELYGDTIDNNTKYQYTMLENGMRKVLGFFVGSGVANAVIDEHKMNAYNDSDTSFAGELWKGLTKGISADLGNQKSYKQNTSNYYAVIKNIRQYKNASNGKDALFDYDTSDLLDANDLYYSRNYSRKYGVYDEDDYKRINNLMKKMIKDNRTASEVYALIVEEFNNGTSEATLRSVLNSNSIIRRLNASGFNKIAYFNSLSDKEKARVRQAIEYEMNMYPLLSKFFPDEEYEKTTYIPRYQRIYNSSGSSYPSKSYSPYTPRYYPGRYYPKTFYYNTKTGSYSGPNLKIVSVNVSPQMAIWNQDYNLTRYDTGLNAQNEPKWLRDKGYVNRTN